MCYSRMANMSMPSSSFRRRVSPKQRFNVPRSMIDVIHLNAVDNPTIKNEVISKTGNMPRADIAESGTAKSS